MCYNRLMRMSGRDLTLKNNTTVEVKTLTPNEAKELLALLDLIYSKNDWLDYTVNEIEAVKIKAVRKKIKAMAKAKRQIMLGAYYEGHLVGLCCVSRVSPREKQSHRAALYICVVESFRGKGLGAALMKMAFDFASKVAYEQFESTVLDGNTPAFILCTEYGFQAMCRFPRAYKNLKGGYQDSILLIKYLNNYEM